MKVLTYPLANSPGNYVHIVAAQVVSVHNAASGGNGADIALINGNIVHVLASPNQIAAQLENAK